MAGAGWDVLFVGIEARGVSEMKLRHHERIRTLKVAGPSGGTWGAVKYARYAMQTMAIARHFKPTWCYASDLLSAPAALLVKRLTGARVVYHEHDAPGRGGRLATAALSVRDRLAQGADIVVVPSEERRPLLPAHAAEKALVAWNCPLREEVRDHTGASAGASVRMVYAGSLSPDRLPFAFVDVLAVLPSCVSLEIYGYGTIGHAAYPDALRARAQEQGLAGRVTFHGTLAHEALLGALARCDIGIATVDPTVTDANLGAMVGASNKSFDYMACGLPFIVCAEPKWRSTFVEPGYAVACAPGDAASIYAAVQPLLDAATRARMGKSAQGRIAADWNYETMFAPVLAAMSA